MRVLKDTPSLWVFLKLANASDDKIVQFAEAWGPLGICAHGKPVTHAGGCQPLGWEARVWLSKEQRSRPPKPGADAEYWEPLAAWRFYARQFSAILSIAYEVSRQRAAHGRHIAALAEPRTHLGPHAVPLGDAFAEFSQQAVQDFIADRARYLPRDENGHIVESPLLDWLPAKERLERLVQETGLRFALPWRVGESAPRNDLSLGEGLVLLPDPAPASAPLSAWVPCSHPWSCSSWRQYGARTG